MSFIKSDIQQALILQLNVLKSTIDDQDAETATGAVDRIDSLLHDEEDEANLGMNVTGVTDAQDWH